MTGINLQQESATADNPHADNFKIRDGLTILGLLIGGTAALSTAANRGYINATPAFLVFMLAAGQVLTIAAIVWLARRRHVCLRELVASRKPWWKEIFVGLLCAAILWGILLALWLEGVVPISDRLSLMFVQTPLATRLIFLAVAALLAPVGEELLYRGVLQGSIRACANAIVACLVQAALFAFMHQKSLEIMLTIFAGGVAYGAITLWRRSLLASIVTHATFNAVAAGWLVALFWLNGHVPAASLDEAASRPDWWSNAPPQATQYGGTAAEQHERVLWLFGSRGLQLWKVEIQELEGVRQRFPDDSQTAARALAGIQEIYLRYLGDPWRAVAAGQELIARYPDQQKLGARAMISNAQAYRGLGDIAQAERWLDMAQGHVGDVPEFQVELDSLRQAIEAPSGE